MRRLFQTLLLATVLAPGTALAQQVAPAAAPAAYEGSFLKRITLLVGNLERSLKIYRDILGFEAGEEFVSSPTSYSYTVFSIDPKARIRGTMLSAGPQVRTLALFEITGQPIVVPASPKPVAAVLRARNLPKVKAAIEAMGLTSYPVRDLKTPEGATGLEWAFIDPDGHLIVLYELNATEAVPAR
jgi:catechol 2,3-dioxygenase-like lactoylglutathione lyase family enzyme